MGTALKQSHSFTSFFYDSTTSAGRVKAPYWVSWSSFRPPLKVDRTANATPDRPSGTRAVTDPGPLLVVSTNVTFVTRLMNPMYSGLLGSALTKNVTGSKLNLSSVPAGVGGCRFGGGFGESSVSFGNTVIGSWRGQETINICTRL